MRLSPTVPRFRLSAAAVRLAQHGQVNAKAGVGLLRASHRLEHQIDRRALLDKTQGVGDMGEHAALRGHFIAQAQIVDQAQQAADGGKAVGRGIDADDRVAAAVHQAVDDGRGNARRVVGGMVGLQPHGHAPGQAQGVAKAADDAAFLRHQNQVLIAHELAQPPPFPG
jgi:hypothetical protein